MLSRHLPQCQFTANSLNQIECKLSSLTKNKNFSTLIDYFANSPYYPLFSLNVNLSNSLTGYFCNKKIEKNLLQLADKCPNLQSFDISQMKVSEETLIGLISKLPKLETFKCYTITRGILIELSKRCRRLRSLDLSRFDDLTDRELILLGKKCLSLETLTLSGTKITEKGITELIADLPNLKSLDMSTCHTKHSRFVPAYSLITNAVARQLGISSIFQSLNLANSYSQLTDVGLKELAKCPTLQSLNLKQCYGLKDDCLKELTKCSELRLLNLTDCSKLTDEGFREICKLSALQSLNLAYCYQLTNISLREIAKCPALESLNLLCCRRITEAGLLELTKCSSLKFVYFDGAPEIIRVKRKEWIEHFKQRGMKIIIS